MLAAVSIACCRDGTDAIKLRKHDRSMALYHLCYLSHIPCRCWCKPLGLFVAASVKHLVSGLNLIVRDVCQGFHLRALLSKQLGRPVTLHEIECQNSLLGSKLLTTAFCCQLAIMRLKDYDMGESGKRKTALHCRLRFRCHIGAPKCHLFGFHDTTFISGNRRADPLAKGMIQLF